MTSVFSSLTEYDTHHSDLPQGADAISKVMDRLNQARICCSLRHVTGLLGLIKHQISPSFIGPRYIVLEMKYLERLETRFCDLMVSSEPGASLEHMLLERPGYVDVIVTKLVDVVSVNLHKD